MQLSLTKLFQNLKAVVLSVVTDRNLVVYGIVLLALHAAGFLYLYEAVPEFDNVPHFWFGYVLSEYSSKAGYAMGLQLRLSILFRKRGWTRASLRTTDFLVRLGGFLLVGGLFWEWAELAFSRYLGIVPDSFFAFPITLRNVDGALDVSMGIVGTILSFWVSGRRAPARAGVG